jgi:phosphate starvation-inducible protein PhoH and related proteins
MKEQQLVIGAGCAGVGKSYLALYHAAKELLEGRINKIVLIRAYQPLAGRSIGFLPGELEDKLIPYYAQMLAYLEDFLTVPRVEVWLKSKTIEICSLETIRGRSWDYSLILLEESQNLYPEEIQALTTRIGQGSQMIVIGDQTSVQTDIKNKQDGLNYLLGVIDKYKIPNTATVVFNYDDICRSDITRDFVIAYDKELAENKSAFRDNKGNQQHKKGDKH